MIAVVDKGVIVELGSHSQLMDQKGIYADLCTQQWGNTDGEEFLGFDEGADATPAGNGDIAPVGEAIREALL